MQTLLVIRSTKLERNEMQTSVLAYPQSDAERMQTI
jgi:hypothetical protein